MKTAISILLVLVAIGLLVYRLRMIDRQFRELERQMMEDFREGRIPVKERRQSA